MSALPSEPDQVPRLLRFRREHPGIPIGPDQFGTWSALIRDSAGERFAVRHTLRELLDKLDMILSHPG